MRRKASDPASERGLFEAPEPADHEEVIVGAEVGIDLGLLGDVAEPALVGVKVGLDVPALEEDLPFRWARAGRRAS